MNEVTQAYYVLITGKLLVKYFNAGPNALLQSIFCFSMPLPIAKNKCSAFKAFFLDGLGVTRHLKSNIKL